MALFGKKKEEAPAPVQMPERSLPVDQVVSMKQQGYSDQQIIDYLGQQGYSSDEIYDAMSQAGQSGGPEPQMQQPSSGANVEQHVESIVGEKWADLQKELSKMVEWRSTMGSRVDKLEQSVADLRSSVDNLHTAIVRRIGEYDKSLMDIGTELKAMEKVFSKSIPELTNNIQELSKVTKDLKK